VTRNEVKPHLNFSEVHAIGPSLTYLLTCLQMPCVLSFSIIINNGPTNSDNNIRYQQRRLLSTK